VVQSGALNALVVENPYLVYAKISSLLYPPEKHQPGIHTSAVIDKTATLHESVSVGANCVVGAGSAIAAGTRVGPGSIIGDNVTIGESCHFVASVTICSDSVIGNRTILHPGVVIGSDGFGLASDGGKWVKIQQIGRAVLGDDVEIGSNTCIDCGAIGDTIIEEGVKLDNLIQVGHNVHIGAHTAIASGAAIAGSARIGKHCTIGGKTGIVGHIEIADNVHVTAMSLVSHSIKEVGNYSSGTPLQTNANWRRSSVRFKQLDDMARRIKVLEKCLDDKNDGN
jgi:UDP-3-O-[3-hydroxymyristoyl] glucosamine N-acyltransferase